MGMTSPPSVATVQWTHTSPGEMPSSALIPETISPSEESSTSVRMCTVSLLIQLSLETHNTEFNYDEIFIFSLNTLIIQHQGVP